MCLHKKNVSFYFRLYLDVLNFFIFPKYAQNFCLLL
jgi:hypothetical protein